MLAARSKKKCIKGVKGVNCFASFEHFNLNWSFGCDYMHQICIGNVKHLNSIWLSEKSKFFKENSSISSISSINEIMGGSKVPRIFTRPINNILESHDWKASQCRDFLLFKGVAALDGNLNDKYYQNFVKLSRAIFIFLKQSITELEFNLASQLIFDFLFEFENLYGETNMRYNIHVLTHLPLSILYNGPLWANSLFCYESKNHFLNRMLHGTYNVVSEASNKISIQQEKFIGVNLRRKLKKRIFQSEIYSNSTVKAINSANFYGLDLTNYVEIKNIIFKGIFYERMAPNKKTDDSFVEIDNELFQIIKIIVKENHVFFLVKNEFDVKQKIDHVNKLEPCIPNFNIVPVNDLIKKAIFIQNSLNYFVLPNNIEFD